MATTGSTAVAGYRLTDVRRFRAVEQEFLFIVDSSAVVGLDPLTSVVVDAFEAGPRNSTDVLDKLVSRFPREALVEGFSELNQLGVLVPEDDSGSVPPFVPLDKLPLSTIVLNVTNKCNLSCKYCYEYGQDRIAEELPSAYMDEETAFESVEFLIANSGSMPRLNLTFFGGETLLNFKVVRSTVEYARRRARESGKTIDFSLTTNATLLTDEVVRFLSENHVGVTVSIDGPKDLQDKLRTFSNGQGSYDQILPRIRGLLGNHRTRPIGARVTLTAQVLDIGRIFEHLTEEIGFYEVGFAPVTTSPDTLYAIGDDGFDSMLGQFRKLGKLYLEKAVRGEYLGFSNMTDTLAEIHTGISKNYACGAGLGLLGVSPSGDIALCHRFVDSPEHVLGNIQTGLDEEKRDEFARKTHLSNKADCHTCWVRGLCSGGCYHEAQVRYGDIGHANLHYCDWIRGWIMTCLETYVEISERNPAFFDRFDERKGYATS